MSHYAASPTVVPAVTPEMFFALPGLTLIGVKELAGRLRLTFRDGNGKRIQRTLNAHNYPHLFMIPRSHEDVYEIMVAPRTITVNGTLHIWGEAHRICMLTADVLTRFHAGFFALRASSPEQPELTTSREVVHAAA